ncbi:MAG TPA: hypothetical protein EYH54_00350 [Nautiliaceae bacterium]|nr:hypothetical protein [Nautiliaceae bacterium]
MLLKKLFYRPNFVSFYKEESIYKLLNEKYKNDKIIFSENKEFNNKKELVKYINLIIESNPQTYTSTILKSINQGIIPSCKKSHFKEMGLDINNIKYICINNKYAFYTSLYELLEIEKEFPFLDFLYSPFSIIDYKAKIRNNSLYILIIRGFLFFMIYKNSIPVFGEIEEFNEKSPKNEDNEEGEIEEIDDLDLLDEINEDIDEIETIEDLDSIEEISQTTKSSSGTHLNIENKVFNKLQEILKEYYENSSDFIENIIIYDTINISNNLKVLIEDELFINTDIQNINLLKTINEMSKKNV